MPDPISPRGATGVAWPGLVVLLGSICAYWLAQNELTTSRPELSSDYRVPAPVGPSAVDATFSRMWEDPISKTYEHWEGIRKKREAEPLPEHPVSRLYEISRRFLDRKSRPKDLTQMFQALVEQHGDGKGRTLCLPVLVNGGANAEDMETRLRTRYAVITALAHAGYKLSFPEKMSYAEVPADVMVLEENEEWRRRSLIVPMKLYRRQKAEASDSPPAGTGELRGGDTDSLDDSKQIVVLWINESQLGLRPLWSLNEVVEKMFGGVTDHDRINFRILGPSSSDTLKAIYDELCWCYDPERENYLGEFKNKEGSQRKERGRGLFLGRQRYVQILSPRATATKLLEDPDDARKRRPHKNQAYFEVIRTIGNDHLLVSHALKPELETRGAWPDIRQDEVLVLLTEHNTSYGRRIVGEFELEFESEADAPQGCLKLSGPPLRVFKYFRGTDGQTAGETEDRSTGSESSAKSTSTGDLYGLPSAETRTRLPQGKSQYDYLRRLKTDLQRLELRQRITAIGVVGSDVYDKLLVLRALRPHFPDAVFFTTDLDAIYEHPNELRHTRNLVIASHYGLRLNAEFHDDLSSHSIARSSMLPFRDSYQTADHLTARIAIGDTRIRDALEQTVLQKDRSGDVFAMALRLWDHEHDHFAHRKRHPDKHLLGVLRPLVTTVGNFGFRQLEAAPLNVSTSDHRHSSAAADARPVQSPGYESHSHDVPEDETGAEDTPGSGRQADTHAGGAPGNGDDQRHAIQPEPESAARSLRAPLTVLLIALGIVGFLAWDQRRSITEMLGGLAPKESGTGSFIPSAIQKLQEGFLNGVIPIAVLLLIWATSEGLFGLEQIWFDGTSVMPRVFIQILIGLSAALTLVQFSRRVCGMWEQWTPTLHPRLEDSRTLDYVLDDTTLPRLQPVVIGNAVAFSSYLLILSAVILYQPFMVTLLLIVGITGLFAAVIWMKFGHRLRGNSGDGGREFFALFRQGTSQLVFFAFTLVVSATAILLIASAIAENDSPGVLTSGGWRPYFKSRGGIATWVLDFSSMAFAHAMICLLFTSVLYSHEWSREFTRYLDKSSRLISHDSKAEPPDQVDSLILIGEATVVTTRYTPWLLVYIIGLLLAYHPTISPVPIPTGLLIILSLAIGILVASTIYLRKIIQQYRSEVMEELRGRLFNVRHEKEREKERLANVRRRWTLLSRTYRQANQP